MKNDELIFFLLDTPGYWAAWFPGDDLYSIRTVVPHVEEELFAGLERPSEYMYKLPQGDWKAEQVMRLIEGTGDWRVVEWERVSLHSTTSGGPVPTHAAALQKS